jgi:hypothetical protein
MKGRAKHLLIIVPRISIIRDIALRIVWYISFGRVMNTKEEQTEKAYAGMPQQIAAGKFKHNSKGIPHKNLKQDCKHRGMLISRALNRFKANTGSDATKAENAEVIARIMLTIKSGNASTKIESSSKKGCR